MEVPRLPDWTKKNRMCGGEADFSLSMCLIELRILCPDPVALRDAITVVLRVKFVL